jgi:hypothetical protein
LTGRVGGQAAADPDHLPADGASDLPRWPTLREQSQALRRSSLLAPAATVDVVLVGMDQHFLVPFSPLSRT